MYEEVVYLIPPLFSLIKSRGRIKLGGKNVNLRFLLSTIFLSILSSIIIGGVEYTNLTPKDILWIRLSFLKSSVEIET